MMVPVDTLHSRRLAASTARHAVRSLHAELTLYPKPGLVSLVDAGSHADMNAATFLRSLFALRGYFRSITSAGIDGASFSVLLILGQRAEQRMLRATGGVNTHRGAIFCLGLLCAATGLARHRSKAHAPLTATDLRRTLLDQWGPALTRHCTMRQPSAHGTGAAIVHGIGGARAQAAAGMPALFEHALPVLRATLAAGRGWECARIDAFFTLLAVLDDTNIYYRGGADGARLVQRHGEEFMARGGTGDSAWKVTALNAHRLFIARRLSPGGAADLLAATCLAHHLTPEGAAPPSTLAPVLIHALP